MKTVLIADDELAIRKLYECELRDEGYEVVTAASAQEAIDATRKQIVDLVIMDIRMPGMDGIEAMNRILEENNELPIVINSAYSAYRDSFMSWPADAYLIKSADLSELKDTVHRILDGKPSGIGVERESVV
ncbi:MAG TPA: response regulator [Planctomycetota bacterium]|nr:response regulator [Planctomycetota bacterium]